MGFGTVFRNEEIHYTALADGEMEDFGPGEVGRKKAFAHLAHVKKKIMDKIGEKRSRLPDPLKVIEFQFKESEDQLKSTLLSRELLTLVGQDGSISFKLVDRTAETEVDFGSFLEVLARLKLPYSENVSQPKI
ncbi:hypothetical protein [Rhizobium sp. ZW T2_16]|uniref:hypothetical protein n=1 Tax=Rhizobium sp. ZW T2_16 TaxID=3378083 RepID=UPI0038538048